MPFVRFGITKYLNHVANPSVSPLESTGLAEKTRCMNASLGVMLLLFMCKHVICEKRCIKQKMQKPEKQMHQFDPQHCVSLDGGVHTGLRVRVSHTMPDHNNRSDQSQFNFFFFLRSFLAAEGPLTQGCCTGQPPGTDCFYTGQSPDVLVVGKV